VRPAAASTASITSGRRVWARKRSRTPWRRRSQQRGAWGRDCGRRGLSRRHRRHPSAPHSCTPPPHSSCTPPPAPTRDGRRSPWQGGVSWTGFRILSRCSAQLGEPHQLVGIPGRCRPQPELTYEVSVK
jgi:hypothetical protein